MAWSSSGSDPSVPPRTGWSSSGPPSPAPSTKTGWTELHITDLQNNAEVVSFQSSSTLRKIGMLSAARPITFTSPSGLIKVATVQGANRAVAVGGSAQFGFPPNSPATVDVTSVGSSTYTIPRWCNYIDIIALGGGGGGTGGGTFTGNGGKASSWAYVTITRGVTIPWTALSLSVVVGDGGSAGSSFGGTGGTGSPSYVQYSGADLVRSAGGVPTSGTGGGRAGDGVSPATLTLSGVTYTGGASSGNDTASYPGSGGRGGGSFSGGNKGGRGEVWLRAYQ